MKRGLAGICACGCGGAVLASGPRDLLPQDSEDMPRRWIAALATSLAEVDPAQARRTLKGCSQAHWDHLAMDETVGAFHGDLPALLAFLREEWRWIIDYDPAAGVIQVNENKSDCVCPLVRGGTGGEFGALCYCSEGFAERLFGAATGTPVQAEVTESILRGGERCRYRIQLPPDR